MTRTGRSERVSVDPYRVEDRTWTREEILRARQEPVIAPAPPRKATAAARSRVR